MKAIFKPVVLLYNAFNKLFYMYDYAKSFQFEIALI